MAKNQVGNWAFILGAVVAVILGIGQAVNAVWATNAWLVFLLVLLGLVIGFVNITKKEVTPFLIAAIALVVTSIANLTAINAVIPIVGSLLQGVVNNAVALVAPAALVVSLRAVYELASEE